MLSPSAAARGTGDDPEAGPQRPVADRARDRDPGDARIEEGVAEQGQAVDGDRDQAGERGLLVDRDQHRARPGARMILPAISKPIATEIVIRPSATAPDARLASHQMWSWTFMRPPSGRTSPGS